MDRFEPPLYNSRIIHTYLQMLRRRYPHVNISDLLAYADMKPYEVEDQGHWFTQRQIDLFYERLVKLTGNPNIAREAGRFAASPESIGAMRQYVLGMVHPAKVYEMIGKASSKFTRSAKHESRRLAYDKVEITVTPYPGVTERSFQCENRIGFFEAICTIFNNRLPEIEHPECIFRGGKVCRYIIRWENTFSDHFRRVRKFFVVGSFAGVVLSVLLLPATISPWVISALLSFLLLMVWFGEHIDKQELARALENLRDSGERLVEQIDINYNNTRLAREIGQIINRYTTLNDMLNGIVSVLEKRLDYDRGMLMLADNKKEHLVFFGGFGYTDEQYLFLKRISFHLNRPDSKGVFVVSYRTQKPFLINDIDDIEEDLSPRSIELARRMGARAFICCPIVCDNESLGVLAVDNIKSKRHLVKSDVSLLMGVSHIIGICIRHIQHLDAREKQLKSVLKVLVSTIDARDPVTKGHSEWVAEFAAGTCDMLGLDSQYREMVRIAALLHDYGKVGIPDSLLKKEDRLTEEEYETVKHHAEKTYEILSEINFDGLLKEVPKIAAAHHERLDGTGYPRGLKGEEIPLGARIIAVADYFEALTASRYYSEPMPIEKAMSLLQEHSGTYFDPKVVAAFIRYYRKNFMGIDTGQEVVTAR